MLLKYKSVIEFWALESCMLMEIHTCMKEICWIGENVY